MPELPRRKLIRLQNYDYSTNGYYFLTFCTRDRKNLFGKIVGAPLAKKRTVGELIANNEIVAAPFTKNESVAAPLTKNETVAAPFTKNESVAAPLTKNESVAAPLAKKELSGRRLPAPHIPTAVNENQIELSTCGQIVQRQWLDLPNQFDHVALDEFVIMPNHIHGILIINNRTSAGMGAQASGAPTVSDIIRSFKSRSTLEYLKFINANNLNISAKIWQRSFHDHIIRHEIALMRIRKYIIDNPMKWKQR